MEDQFDNDDPWYSECDKQDLSYGDLQEQLSQKERDLTLAAELGKALLDRNQELMRQYADLQQEHSDSLEFVNQEKHELRCKLEKIKGDYELRIHDLENEVMSLKQTIDEQTQNYLNLDTSKDETTQELGEQINRLNQQLNSSRSNEDDLAAELESVRNQISDSATNFREYKALSDFLQSQISSLEGKKEDLERKLFSSNRENSQLKENLMEWQERNRALESDYFDQSSEIANLRNDVQRLEDVNLNLIEKLNCFKEDNNVSRKHSVNYFHNMNPHEIEDDEMISYEETSTSHNWGAEPEMYEELSVDEEDLSMATGFCFCQNEELKKVLSELNALLNQCLSQNTPHNVIPSPHELSSAVAATITHINGYPFPKHSAFNQSFIPEQKTQDKIESLQEKILELEADREMIIKDKVNAITRQSDLEKQLAHSKLTAKQLQEELLDMVKSKILLSQQLDQWQHNMFCYDMHSMLEDQVQRQLHDDPPKDPRRKSLSFSPINKSSSEHQSSGSVATVARSNSSSTGSKGTKKKFSLFQR